MARIIHAGVPVETSGELPAVGSIAPRFTLVGTDLKPFSSAKLVGRLLLDIVPSVDTGVCPASVRRLDGEAAHLDDVTVLCISRDLPFAQARACRAEGIERVRMGSDFNGGAFGRGYGVELLGGSFAALLARSVVVIDGDGTVLSTQLVPAIGDEPDYERAIAAALA